MSKDTVLSLTTPDNVDTLAALLRDGARKLLAQAVEAELETFLAASEEHTDLQDRRAVVRTGMYPNVR
jgi:putative transposase